METGFCKKRSLEDSNETATSDNIKKKIAKIPLTHKREYTTVLVSNLPKSVNQGKLRKLFSDCGKIRHVDIADSLEKKSRFAKIEFFSYDECLSALTKTNKYVGQNEIKVDYLRDCTLWITNFPPYYDIKFLKQLFHFLNVVVLSIRLPSKKFNSSRRFAYIDVTSTEDAKKCVDKLNKKCIDGYDLVVKLSNPLERNKRTDSASLERRELFIRNLDPRYTTEEELRSYFDRFGEIESIHIPSSQQLTNDEGSNNNDNRNRIRNACAFISYKIKEDAQKSLQLNETEWNGRVISVSLADSKPYLDRQRVKKLMNNHTIHTSKNNRIMSLYPINDKVSKEQIRSFLWDQKCIEQDSDIENIYLVTDYQGCIIEFKDMKKCNETILRLQGTKFYNQMIHCGTIANLRNNKYKNYPSSIKIISPTENQNDQSNRKSNVMINKESQSKSNMSNADFRKIFLGK